MATWRQLERIQKMGLARNIGMSNMTVSYTHLDVYKRQVGADDHEMVAVQLEVGNGAEHGFQHLICLLYTSRCV